jgi:hypothetical protein
MTTFPQVFIGTPTHACKVYCAERFVEATLRNAPGSLFAVLCNSKDSPYPYTGCGIYDHLGGSLSDSHFDNAEAVHRRIVSTCNVLRDMFLVTSCDLYLSLESDVILDADTLPRMIAALSDEYPVVYANCYRWPDGRPFLEQKVAGPTDRITMGCTLMKRSVLEQIEYRYDPNLLGAFPDAFFAYDCREKGIGMWYDPAIWVEHVEDPTARGQGSIKRGWGELPKSEQWWRTAKKG